MKIVVAALVAVALATPAMAFDVKWGGDFNNRFSFSNQADVSHKNLSGEGYATNYVDGVYDLDSSNGDILGAGHLPNFAKKAEDSDFLGEVKYRLWLTATDDDKKVNGTLGFEFGGAEFGSNTKADFAGDKNIFELRHAYIDFEVPFDTASRVYVGLQPVGYNKFLWSDNGAGVKYVATRGNLGYSLGWFRDDNSNGGEGSSTKLQNDDVYAFDVTYALDNGPKLNAFVLYLEEGQDTDAGFAPAEEYMDQQMWYGLAASGQVDKFFYGATFIREEGEISYSDGAVDAAFGRDRDAWLANLEGTVKLDQTKLKLGWLYTTGDDDATDGDAENFTNIDAYMGGFGSVVVFDSFADDNTMVTGPYILDKGLNMVYLGADYDLSDKASVGASYLWINAAEDLDFGDNTFTKASKEIGHELTARASYKLTKNLTAGIDAGYLIVGDGLDEANKEAFGEGADNIWRSDASVRLKF